MDLQELYYWFHKHPELAYNEFKTTAKIRAVLQEAGIKILDSNLNTGLIAKISGQHRGKSIALRSDIDALPIQEENDFAYVSEHPGVMHACGHDFHITALLGAAVLLQEKRERLKGTVYLIFQPAEEAPGGAEKIVATGLLEEVEEYYAIHTAARQETGTIAISEGPVMAAVDRFTIQIEGRGTHAAHPDLGVDPIVTAAAMIQNIQTIVSRNLDPFTAGLVSVTHIEGGNTWNVIPEQVFLEGTVRSLSAESRSLIHDRLIEIADHTAASYGAKASLQWMEGPPAVINDRSLCQKARRAASLAGLSVMEEVPSLGGEDFSLYLSNDQKSIPSKGAFLRIGTGGSYPNHHPKFTADPEALDRAALFLAEIADL